MGFNKFNHGHSIELLSAIKNFSFLGCYLFFTKQGYNFEGDTLSPQNFKYVGLEKIHFVFDDL